MAPVKHTVGSAIASTAGDAAVSATGYGLGGMVTGAVVGALIIGGVGVIAGGLTALGAYGASASGYLSGNALTIAKSIADGATIALGAAGAGIGAIAGGLGGMAGGGLLGAVSGIFKGSERVREEDQQYLDAKRSFAKKGPNPEHNQLAEKYAAAGYVQAMTDMQSMAEAQMQQMAMMQSMQEQANAKAKQDFAAKLSEKHKCCKHTQRAEVSKTEANAAAQLG